MEKLSKTLISIIIIHILFSVHCARKEEGFKKACAKYCQNKTEENREKAFEMLVEYTHKESFVFKVRFEREAVWTSENNAMRFFWPRRAIIDNGDDREFSAIDSEKGMFGFFRKNEITVYDGNGSAIIQQSLPSNENIFALCFVGDDLYFLQSNKLMMRSQKGEIVEVISQPIFNFIPSAQNHRILMRASGNLIATNCGNAGVYRLTVVHRENKKIVVKDIENASFRFGLWDDTIAYIVGSSGNWSLVKMNILNGQKKVFQQFSALEDVAFTDAFAYIREKGLVQVIDLELEKRFALPKTYDVLGAGVGHVLLQKGEKSYLLKARDFFEGIRTIEECI